MSWAEERRANKAVEREQARLDANAASARRIRERNALAEQAREDTRVRAEQARVERAERRQRRSARWAGARAWAAQHRVDLLIYPLAVASAVMAVPSMADYGWHVYGNATGTVLPVLSELGMWAFALAVQLARRTQPERPVWALQLGTWLFAGIAFTLNALHGLQRGLDAGVVMGVASIAGVVAHQLVTANPRRTRAERDEARVARREASKIAAVRRAAVRQAVAEIEPDGIARLVYAPGRYVLDRGRLTEAIVPSPPVGPQDGGPDELDRELAALLAGDGPPTLDQPDPHDTLDDSPIATLEPEPEPESAPESGRDRATGQRKSRRKRHPNPRHQQRTLADLRAEFRAALAERPDSIDPGSAESIRRALRCSPARARQLRDEYRDAT
jgi:hypothetical protein